MRIILKLLIVISVTAVVSACKKPRNNPQPDSPSAKPSWQFFTTSNSRLPSPQINAIAVSKTNVKWIGTGNGLLRISGDSWTVYHAQNSGLPSSIILSLAVQDDGTIWAGTDKGLARFNGNNWFAYTPANSMLPDQTIMSLAHDSPHKRTWVGTAKGIVEIGEQDKWMLHDETEGELPLSLATDQTGALWIGAHDPFSFRGSIKKFGNGGWTSYELDGMGYPSSFPYGIAVDKDNAVVAVLAGTSVRAVIKFTGAAWQELALPQNAPGMRAIALEQDNLWAGGSGFIQLSGAAPKVIDIPEKVNSILSLAVDQQGYKWLGTLDNGLAVYHE